MTPTPTAIDLYHGDTVTSFSDLASAGIQRVVHKATEGATDVDPTYAERQPEAIAAGLQWEAYHFWRPDDATDQSVNFLEVVLAGPRPSAYWLDYEVAGGTPTNIMAAMEAISEGTGKPTGLYTTKTLAQALAANSTGAQMDFFEQCPLWLAEPGVQKPVLAVPASSIWPKISLLQYTWAGKIKGVSGNVDLNCVPT